MNMNCSGNYTYNLINSLAASPKDFLEGCSRDYADSVKKTAERTNFTILSFFINTSCKQKSAIIPCGITTPSWYQNKKNKRSKELLLSLCSSEQRYYIVKNQKSQGLMKEWIEVLLLRQR